MVVDIFAFIYILRNAIYFVILILCVFKSNTKFLKETLKIEEIGSEPQK
jgi:hypothetical protein